MRQATPITNLLLAVCFSALAALSLGLPWYAAAEAPSGSGDGAMEAIASDVYEFFTLPGTAGSEVLGSAGRAILVLAAVTAGLALLMLLGVARSVLRDVLRFVPLAAPILVLVKAVDHPAPGLELRYGVLVAFACAAFAASAAFRGSELTDPKPKPKPYAPPPPPAGTMSPPRA